MAAPIFTNSIVGKKMENTVIRNSEKIEFYIDFANCIPRYCTFDGKKLRMSTLVSRNFCSLWSLFFTIRRTDDSVSGMHWIPVGFLYTSKCSKCNKENNKLLFTLCVQKIEYFYKNFEILKSLLMHKTKSLNELCQ